MVDSRGPAVIITAFTLTSLSTVVVTMRFYCRHFVVGAIKTSDYIMVAALIMTWVVTVINYYQVYFGTGLHMSDKPKVERKISSISTTQGCANTNGRVKDPTVATEYLRGTLVSWYFYQIAYLVDLFLVKLSILVFYRSIAVKRKFRYVGFATISFVTAFTITMVTVNIFECPNPADAWSVELLLSNTRSNGCYSIHSLHSIYFGQAGFNIASDIVILLLPMPMLINLKLRRTKRIALVCIFSVGIIAILASIIRVWALYTWSVSPEPSYTGGNILVWTQIEINCGIISASVPSLKPLVARRLSPSFSSPNTFLLERHFPYLISMIKPDKAGTGLWAVSPRFQDTEAWVLGGSRDIALKSMTSPSYPSRVHGFNAESDDEEPFIHDSENRKRSTLAKHNDIERRKFGTDVHPILTSFGVNPQHQLKQSGLSTQKNRNIIAKSLTGTDGKADLICPPSAVLRGHER